MKKNMSGEEDNQQPRVTLAPSVAVYSQIPPPPPVNMNGNLAENLKFFKKSWSNYIVATELDKKAKNVVLATLYTVLGTEVNQIAENLPVTDLSNSDSLMEALSKFFEAQKNTIFERYLFNTANQGENENIDQYLNRFRKLAATCDYGTLTNQLIRGRLVIGIGDAAVRMLREKKLKLESAVDMVRASEKSNNQFKQMEHESSIHVVRKKRGKMY